MKNFFCFYEKKMRQLLIIVIISVIYNCSSYAFPSQDFGIHIHAPAFPNQVITLGYYLGNQTFLLDSILLDTEGTGDYHDLYHKGIYLLVFPDEYTIEVMVDGTGPVNLSRQGMEKSARIEGNDVAVGYNSYFLMTQNRQGDRDSVLHNLSLLMEKNSGNLLGNYLESLQNPEPVLPEISPDTPNPDSIRLLSTYRYYEEHYLDNLVLTDPGLIYTPVLEDKVIRYISRLSEQKPFRLSGQIDALMAREMDQEVRRFLLEMLLRYYSAKVNKPVEEYMYLYLVKNYFLNGEAAWIGDQQMKVLSQSYTERLPASLLQPAPEIELPDRRRENRSIRSIEAPYTLLIFWDYSCDHCRRALEDIVKTWRSRPESGVEVFAVFTGENLNVWEAYLEQKLPAEWTHVYLTSGSPVLYEYHVDRLPSMFLLNERKIIIDKSFTATDFSDFLEELTGPKTKER